MTGVIKSLPEGKQFGFIKGPSGEYFFHREEFTGHWSDLLLDFRAGRKIHVTFEEVASRKGLRASGVKRTDWPNGG